MTDLSLLYTTDSYEVTVLLALAAVLNDFVLRLRRSVIACSIYAGILTIHTALDVVRSCEHIRLLTNPGALLRLFLDRRKPQHATDGCAGHRLQATDLRQVPNTNACSVINPKRDEKEAEILRCGGAGVATILACATTILQAHVYHQAGKSRCYGEMATQASRVTTLVRLRPATGRRAPH